MVRGSAPATATPPLLEQLGLGAGELLLREQTLAPHLGQLAEPAHGVVARRAAQVRPAHDAISDHHPVGVIPLDVDILNGFQFHGEHHPGLLYLI